MLTILIFCCVYLTWCHPIQLICEAWFRL